MMGDPVGTAFAPINDRGSSRRLWIGFASHPQGTLVADSGAAKAVRGGAASLLAAGVVEVKAISPPATPSGLTTSRATIWPRAWSASTPRRSRRC